VIWTVIPAALLVAACADAATRRWLGARCRRWHVGLAVWVALYAAILATVAVTEWRLKARLARFDLDGNGWFSGGEITPELRAALHAVASDTGRQFAPVTGAVAAGLAALMWVALCAAIAKARRP